ncbi:hypothetical protein INS49_014372 [Diaporthe citri]|uniref:uncharacterized protein n=1 Tax=Diaporthe citri TaxID=83186 RepID=UPI001C8169E4|nr:uncharacterized protein INS49_014372 [Diaporthe citri]KAG6358488.1 hypothetical protein INS49_014372 [Diaporthe citri]
MSTPSKKPFTLIVPGGMTPAAVYDPVVAEVTRRGHDIRAVQLPSVRLRSETGPVREPPTMYEDAALIAREAEVLADDGRDVIIISHSYGGVPATESVRGLSKAARAKEGKPGGVVRLAYMTSLVPELGAAANEVLTNRPRAAGTSVEMDMDEHGWIFITDPAQAASLIAAEIPVEEGERLARELSYHSSTSFTSPLTYAGYKDVAVSYLLCEKDITIPHESQADMIELVERESGNKVDVTRIQAGHAPNLTAFKEVVDWIVGMAEKAVADGAGDS